MCDVNEFVKFVGWGWGANFGNRISQIALRHRDSFEKWSTNPDNTHWKRVEEMETEHSASLKNIAYYTQMLQGKALSSNGTIGGLDDITKSKKV